MLLFQMFQTCRILTYSYKCLGFVEFFYNINVFKICIFECCTEFEASSFDYR